jgi:hypothetical protein
LVVEEAAPLGVVTEIRECPPSTLKNIDVRMIENINDGPPWEVPELEIQEHPH